MKKRLVAFGAALIAALSSAVLVLALVINLAGTNAPLMLNWMRELAPEQTTGLPDSEYPGVVEMITDYLAERTDEFQYRMQLTADARVACFNEKEQQHMADCLILFRLARHLALGCAVVLGGMLLVLFIPLRDYRKERRGGLLSSFSLVLLLLAVLAIWAAIDFDGLFILFHRLSFSNDLWLMDWNRDLIIRLMPIEFFIRYAALIGGVWLVYLLAAEAVLLRQHVRHKKNDL